MAAEANCLIYLLRHDLRLSDNPIFDRLASSDSNEFTHLLPVYVFPAQSVELSGFINDGSPSPFPAAKSKVSKVWRTGPHRAKFITQCVWDLKENLESMGSGLLIRVGKPSDIVSDLIEGLSQKQLKVGGLWITKEEGVEEREEVKAISELCVKTGAALTLFEDEKYFIDDRDLPVPVKDIPLVFTDFRKSVEPLRSKPRAALPKPEKGKLPLFPKTSQVPSQRSPFVVPTSYNELENAILTPVRDFLPGMAPYPEGAESAHPFSGGESSAHERLRYLIKEGLMYTYKETRNGLLGPAFSTKLSGYLSQGCITARQIHHELVKYEDGTDPEYEHAKGYNEGHLTNHGTLAVRMELVWRDYMRLCTKKHRDRLFSIDGFQHQGYAKQGETERKKAKWKSYVQEDALPDQDPPPEKIAAIIDRFNAGTTGQGLIDASQRELLYTGYTSNRARQNVASFLTKHLGIDWRIGAEWYELLLVDYDVSSNWANWQYVAGVGNDPRGDSRVFNPVKQAFDYDKTGAYVKAWIPEVRALENLENVFQVCSASPEVLEKAGLSDNVMATDPVKRIPYTVDGKPKASKRSAYRGPRPRRGGDRSHDEAPNGHNGDGWAPRGGHSRGGGAGRGGPHWPRRGHQNGRGGYPTEFHGYPPATHHNYQPYPYPVGHQPMMHPDYSRGVPMIQGQGHPVYTHPQPLFIPPQHYGQTPYPPQS